LLAKAATSSEAGFRTDGFSVCLSFRPSASCDVGSAILTQMRNASFLDEESAFYFMRAYQTGIWW
jgi:hypothetical protein